MAYYKDVREYLAALEGADLLVRVDRKINKDTELNPLVRLQFRGLPESDRKAFLFTNVTDVSGRQFSIPVVVGCLAASRRIYGMGLQCDPSKIAQQWAKARGEPIEPVFVDSIRPVWAWKSSQYRSLRPVSTPVPLLPVVNGSQKTRRPESEISALTVVWSNPASGLE